MQSNSEASDKPVLFVEASHPSSSDNPQMAQSSPTPRPQAPCVSDQAGPAADSTSHAAGISHQQSPGHRQGPPPGMGLREWIRQKKKDSAASGSAAFPSVQVFCPGGGADPQQDGRLDQQAGQSVSKSGAAEACCSSGAAGAHGRDGVCSQAVYGQDSDR